MSERSREEREREQRAESRRKQVHIHLRCSTPSTPSSPSSLSPSHLLLFPSSLFSCRRLPPFKNTMGGIFGKKKTWDDLPVAMDG